MTIRDVWFFVPTLIISVLYAWTSYKNKEFGGNYIYWVWAVNLIPIFPLLSKYSKNLVRDGAIYSVILLIGYLFTLMYLGESKGFNSYQWVGISMVVCGYIFLNMGE